MADEPAHRLLDHLPAFYATDDVSGDLARLLSVFDELLFVGGQGLPGIERQLLRLPSLFAPLDEDGFAGGQTPEAFLPWLATWLAFEPLPWLTPHRLRHVLAGIVPMYGLRGTPGYLMELVQLCFDEVRSVHVEDGDIAGLRLGRSRVGEDSVLDGDRPFRFSVTVEHTAGSAEPRFEQRLRAVIDFARPAHTAYELRLLPAAVGAPRVTP